MPIENEKKYVLKQTGQAATKFENTLRHVKGAKAYAFRQGYVSDMNRIREVVSEDGTEKLYVFTFKLKVNGNLIEIEKYISEWDFNQLWTKVDRIITKTRIKIPFGGLIWEVDFIKTALDNTCYLTMAEVEMPDDMLKPDTVPAFVADNLLYEVPTDDKRFINANLSVPKVVTRTLKELELGQL